MTNTAPAAETDDNAEVEAYIDARNTKSDFVAPSSQEELNRIIGERLARERAKFADYHDIKTTAEALAFLSGAIEHRSPLGLTAVVAYGFYAGVAAVMTVWRRKATHGS